MIEIFKTRDGNLEQIEKWTDMMCKETIFDSNGDDWNDQKVFYMNMLLLFQVTNNIFHLMEPMHLLLQYKEQK